MSVLETIKGRRSVRTFDGRAVSQEDREKLEQFISGISNPFGIPVEFILLDAGKYGLSSPVITGEKLYVAGKDYIHQYLFGKHFTERSIDSKADIYLNTRPSSPLFL